jgi:hypothetical protein
MKRFRNIKLFLIVSILLSNVSFIISQNTNSSKIALEQNGFVLVEAENFVSQSNSEVRKWYVKF